MEQPGVRPPQQARSQTSTGRMLDAALTILDRDGLAGVTIAAISRESGVSNGALYHRFGDRHGLLVAAQDRFLSQLEADWLSASAPIWAIEDPETLLSALVAAFLRIFTEQRRIFRAFLMSEFADPALRARGLAGNERAARFIVDQLAARFGCPPAAAAVAHQIIFGQLMLIVLFDDDEIPTQRVTPDVRRAHLVQALIALLRGG